jgi:hypothetical protein
VSSRIDSRMQPSAAGAPAPVAGEPLPLEGSSCGGAAVLAEVRSDACSVGGELLPCPSPQSASIRGAEAPVGSLSSIERRCIMTTERNRSASLIGAGSTLVMTISTVDLRIAGTLQSWSLILDTAAIFAIIPKQIS